MRRGPGQGEAGVAWAIWGTTTLATLLTYARLEPEETYNVSESGLAGGLSRALVHVNFPVALAAIPLVLVAAAALRRRVWRIAGPAIALCATVPFVVDQADLDARWINTAPALGVAVALGLTLAAAARAGWWFEPALPGDRIRVWTAAALAVLSLPWIAALLGFHLPGDVFLGEEVITRGEETSAAVHLGAHHGLYGALLLATALLLSRVDAGTGATGVWLGVTVAGLAGYGALNFVQDLWLEQVVKRGWTDSAIPNALLPGFDAVTAVWLALAAVAWWLARRERAILRA